MVEHYAEDVGAAVSKAAKATNFLILFFTALPDTPNSLPVASNPVVSTCAWSRAKLGHSILSLWLSLAAQDWHRLYPDVMVTPQLH